MDPILIIDDEKDNLEALQRLLRANFNVTVTTSPFEALQLIQSHRYHVIVSDQRMPQMTGVELLEKSKKLSPLSTRILLTGYTDIESVIDAINRGQVYRYISKPWEPEELKITLRQSNEAYLLRRELEDKNKALNEALADLTLLDRAKARFLSLVSHELNTPLTVVQSFVALLSESKVELPTDAQRAIHSLENASHRFSEIVGQVLNFVRMESENKLILESADLAKMLDLVQQTVLPAAQKRGIQFNTQVQLVPPAKLDVDKMNAALRGLFLDMIRRAPTNSEVDVLLKKQENQILLSITREGEPLPETAFAVLETGAPQMHHQQNLGLDLALCRTVIERHHGKISVRIEGAKTCIDIELAF